MNQLAIDTASIIAIAVFCVGVIYQAGRFSVRVEKLEEWRGEQQATNKKIADAIDRLERVRPQEVV